jgi:RNA polymerase sigma-70 factor (ECF subfamily)
VEDATPVVRLLPDVDLDVADASAAARDPQAFDAIYRRHRLAVYRYARSRTTDNDAAREITAVTFERGLRSIGSFRPRGGGMLAWLLRIARNASIDEARRSFRQRAASERLSRSEPDGHRPEAETELWLMVARLPERQRDVVGLRYAGGLTAREIGAVLGISEGAAQKHLERALSALREAYRDD